MEDALHKRVIGQDEAIENQISLLFGVPVPG